MGVLASPSVVRFKWRSLWTKVAATPTHKQGAEGLSCCVDVSCVGCGGESVRKHGRKKQERSRRPRAWKKRECVCPFTLSFRATKLVFRVCVSHSFYFV